MLGDSSVDEIRRLYFVLSIHKARDEVTILALVAVLTFLLYLLSLIHPILSAAIGAVLAGLLVHRVRKSRRRRHEMLTQHEIYWGDDPEFHSIKW